MRYFVAAIVLLCFFPPLNCIKLYGQQHTVRAKNGMTATPANYSFFTSPAINKSDEAIQNNQGFESHPELGVLFAETPCDNCYELIGKRTETSKTFIKEGTRGSSIMQQTSNAAMHYRDANGNWRTIQTLLQPVANQAGVFAATEQPVPVTVNTAMKFVSLGKPGETFEFNHNLELIYAKPDGSQMSLGAADWTHITAGDDGVYAKNAWPGIDIEMHTIRGAIKTNFWINNAMPAYADGQLLVRDHLIMEDGWTLYAEGQTSYTGNLEVRNRKSEKIYAISAATAFEKSNIKSSLQMLPYIINGHELDIALPGDFLNRPSSAYPVIIDPLVSIATPSTVGGSTYSPAWTVGCVYTNAATVPAEVTVTDVQFNFQYVTSGGALLDNGAFDFYLGTCRSPTPSALYWNCNSLLTGTCTGTAASILPSFTSCMPVPSCSSYNLDLTMDFYQDYASAPPCSNLYITASSPLTITVFGRTIETSAITASSSTICQGQSTNLSATSSYGVPPYTFVWTPGGLTGASVTESPASTTTYTVTSTDVCGNTSTATSAITVNPASPITGITTVCQGGTTTLSNTSAGGTWSSGSAGIASINASGVLTGESVGTATITYNTLSGCALTTIVTVNPPVGAVTGITRDCEASSITLSSSPTGGTWTTGNASIATVYATTGVVIGVSAGTTTITYSTYGGGCYSVTTMSIDPLSPISGPATVCLGGTATLSDAVSGGTWESTGPSVAGIGSSSGVVSGLSVGTATIVYTTIAGCSATASISVISLTAITGILTMCPGGTTVLSDAATGGVWSSSNTAIATAGAGTGMVTGVSGGTAVITYGTAGGCAATAIVTVNAAAPISGTAIVCTGGTTLLTDATTGGTWSSGNTSVATAGITSGVVTGVAVGTVPVIYTSAAGCTATINVTVNSPTPITGNRNICQGGTTALADITTGGTWSSSNSLVAPVVPGTGVVTGSFAGTATITYSAPGGCAMTAIVTVNPLSSVSGTTTICMGGAVTLGYPTSGGTWSSSNTVVATIGSATGIIAGLSTGTAAVTYTTPAGCTATTSVTVILPAAIIGASSVCQASSATLSNTTTGGTWASSNTSVAIVNTSTGVTTGLSAGTATITYSTPGGCSSTTTVTVNAQAPVTGMSTMCQGSTVTLGDAVTGGTWSSLNTAIATVSITSGAVTGLLPGTTTIRYTTGSGCISAIIVTVFIQPASISGAGLVCSTTSLGDAVTGGTWTCSNTAVATVGATGLVTAATSGTITVTYAMPGGCYATKSLTVDPIQPILGSTSICQGSTTTLSYAFSGGTWSSLSTAIATVDAVTGVVTGVSGGSSVIQYTTVSGCVATVIGTVNAIFPLSGLTTLCQGSTTALTDAAGSGTWASTNSAIASVGITTGIVTGVSAGTAAISYTTSAGCMASTAVTVNPLAAITGVASMCAGNTSALSDATSGGAWSSLGTAIASVDAATGIVTGMSAGAATIKYTTAEGCIATVIATVYPVPSDVSGNTPVCVGNTAILSDPLLGGVWVSGNTAVATIVGATGVVTGASPGIADVTYTTTGGCFITATITVNPLPAAIAGITSICQGGTTALSDGTTAGSWSSVNTAVAIIDAATGIVSGLSPGISTIKYTTPAGCFTSIIVTVNPLPAAITGTTIVCLGASATLHNALTGGSWSSGNTAIAIIVAGTGVFTGVATGAATISYTTPFGCFAVTGVMVNPTPVITGSSSSFPTHCNTTDGTITLTGLTAGETYTVTYSFGGTPVTLSVTADGAGNVTIPGLAAGTYNNFSVTTSLGCTSNIVSGPIALSLPATPPAPVAGNNTPICAGVSLNLTATDVVAGAVFSWSGPLGFTSALQNPAINPSAVDQSGTYTVTATYLGCTSAPATTEVVVHPIPDITNISFTDPQTCLGTDGTITLTGLAASVSYIVDYAFNAAPESVTEVADGSGKIAIGNLSSGTYSDIYVSSFTCLSNTIGPVTLVDPLPPPPPALGNNGPVCSGKTLLLTSSDAITDLTYSWTGPNSFIATVQDPQILNVSMADSGLYSLTIKHLNCPASATENVIIRPPVILTDVTASQAIPYGSSKQLLAEGAEYYLWWPDDGSLSNPNIKNPIATPQDSTTYIVEGVNEWGCLDSAYVSLSIDFDVTEGLPNAFSPNGDGLNDIFRLINAKYDILINFSVFNRWGQMVYHNESDITKGWDGRFNGVMQETGTYYYIVVVSTPEGKNKEFKGDVTLIR